MKKVLLGVLVLAGFFISGCSTTKETNSNEIKSPSSTESTTEINASTQNSSEKDAFEMSFKDKTLTGVNYKLTIDKTQVGHSNPTDEDGLIIWYTVENKSEDNLVPNDILSLLTFKQQDETSEFDLTEDVGKFDAAEALYPMYNDDGSTIEDVDTYNTAISEQNKFYEEFEEKSYAELLPGKSVQCATGILLNNTVKPVNVSLSEDMPTSENEPLVINLSK